MEQRTGIRVDEERKSITLYDMTDQYNGTTAYNRNIRSFKKAVAFINENMESLKAGSFWQAVTALDAFKLNMHTYCSVD